MMLRNSTKCSIDYLHDFYAGRVTLVKIDSKLPKSSRDTSAIVKVELKKEKLSSKLRENLRKRKIQARARSEGEIC